MGFFINGNTPAKKECIPGRGVARLRCGFLRSAFQIAVLAAFSFLAPLAFPAQGLATGKYGSDLYWVGGISTWLGTSSWAQSYTDINAETTRYQAADWGNTGLHFEQRNSAVFRKCNDQFFPHTFDINVNGDVYGDNYLLVDITADYWNWTFTSSGELTRTILGNTSLIFSGGTTGQGVRSVLFDHVNLFYYENMEQYGGQVSFVGSSINYLPSIVLYSGDLIWDGANSSRNSNYAPSFAAGKIVMNPNSRLYLKNVVPGRLTIREVVAASNTRVFLGVGGTTPQAFSKFGFSIFAVPYLTLQSGHLILDRPTLSDLTVDKGATLEWPSVGMKPYTSALHVDGTVLLGDALMTPKLEGTGLIRLVGTASLGGVGKTTDKWGNQISTYENFTGPIDLNGHIFKVTTPLALGKAESILGGGYLEINTPKDAAWGPFSLSSVFSNTGTKGLTIETQGAPLTLLQTAPSHGPALHKRGAGELVLSGGHYQYPDMRVMSGKMTLTGGVEITANPLRVYSTGIDGEPASVLNVAGQARLDGDLEVQTATLSLESGALTVDGDTRFQNLPSPNTLLYQDGRLATKSLELGNTLFAADLPHPGVYVVAEYETLLSRFSNDSTKDLLRAIRVNGHMPEGTVSLHYGAGTNSRILLEAGNGHNMLFRTQQGLWEYGDKNWQTFSGMQLGWDNRDSHIAVFGADGATPGLVSVGPGGASTNMLSFIQEGWTLEAPAPDKRLTLRPFSSDPKSSYYFATLNSQVTGAGAPRLKLDVLTNTQGVPVWKTGGGDLILASDGTVSKTGLYSPLLFAVKSGRLILEHEQALGGNVAQDTGKQQTIAIDSDASLVLRYLTADKTLYSLLEGAGQLDIERDANLGNTARPNFSGPVLVRDNVVLSIGNRMALGAGEAAVALGTSANLALGYRDEKNAFPRTITGAGGVSLLQDAVVRLSSGSSYTGGTTLVGNNSVLYLGGPGEGSEFTAAGSGPIHMTGTGSEVVLTSGGIVRNELAGGVSNALRLEDGRGYVLEDNNIRTDGTNFTGAVILGGNSEVTLKADVAKGAGVTPPFSLGGTTAHTLVLDGPGVTFSGLRGNIGNGVTRITDKTTLELGDTPYSLPTERIDLDGVDSLLDLRMTAAVNTMSNPLLGTGTVRLNDNAYTLSGANDAFAGIIKVGDGRLNVDDQSRVGLGRLLLNNGMLHTTASDLRNTITLSGGATLETGSDLELWGRLTGEGRLTKTGAATLTLTGMGNDYKGSTDIVAGELRLENGALTGKGPVSIGNARLSGYGSIAGAVTNSAGGTFALDGNIAVDALKNSGALIFSHGARLDVANSLELLSSSLTVNLDALGVYTLADYGSTNLSNGVMDASQYTVNYNGKSITHGGEYRLGMNNLGARRSIVLTALPTGQKVAFWDEDGGGTWNTNGAANWNTNYEPGIGQRETWDRTSRIAVFGSAGVTTPGEITVQGPVQASGMFFLTPGWSVSGDPLTLLDLDPGDTLNYAVISSQNGEIVFDTVLTGSAGLQKTGSGTVVLNAANTYTGSTLVSAGTLELGHVKAAGRNPGIAVAEDAVLRLSYDNPDTPLPQTISGKGVLEVTGRVLLDKANTHTGGTIVDFGTLHLAHNNALGTGGLIFRNGELVLANGLNVGNTVSLRGNGDVVTVSGNDRAELSGQISGGSLTKTGTGTLSLTGNNEYTGGTLLSQGKLVAGHDFALGMGTVAMQEGAILGFSGSRSLDNAFYLLGGARFETTPGNDAILNGVIGGSGSLIKTGAGKLTLGGANIYAGPTAVLAGSLALASGGRISDTLALYDGTEFDAGSNQFRLARLDVEGRADYLGDLDVSSGTMLFRPTQSGPLSGSTLLRVTGAANIDGSRVTLDLGNRNKAGLQPGQTLTLINAGDGLSGVPVNTEVAGRLGITRAWTAGLSWDANNLYAGITHVGASPESKALAEGFLAGLALTTQGADLAAGQGMTEAVRATDRAGAVSDSNLVAFGAISGSKQRLKTGSHTDMKSFSLLTGLATGGETKAGRLTVGAFFEYGNGSYDTYNSFSGASSVKGDGHAHYTGGGVLTRMDFTPSGSGRFYAEASGRAGNVSNSYENGDLRDSATGQRADYDTSSAYYGLHAGLGYVWNATETTSVEVHGKYFWTRQEGDSVRLSNGDPVSFKDADSSRLRLGGRVSHDLNEYVSPYVGLAWEHEFDAKVRATTYGYSLRSPDLEGGTGIGEVGIAVRPSKDLPLSLDFSVQGYVGQREGVTGSMQLTFNF